MNRIVVCDTGPLLHLIEADAIHLLRMTGEVLIPPMVAHEFLKNSAEIPLPNWIKIQELDDLHQIKAVEFAKRIDDGESAAIALTLQSQATWLLSDDTKARQFAESLGLEVHGSIGLLLWGVAANHVANRNDAYRMLDALANSSLWVSERVLREARKAIEIIFPK